MRLAPFEAIPLNPTTQLSQGRAKSTSTESLNCGLCAPNTTRLNGEPGGVKRFREADATCADRDGTGWRGAKQQ